MAKSVATSSQATKLACLEVKQHQHQFYLTVMDAGLLTFISYVAEWKVDKEEGAVQRPLNSRRIDSLKAFALAGGDYPNSIVLNWRGPLEKGHGFLQFAPAERLAQTIDGQHRLEGLREAIVQNQAIKTIQVPVAIYHNLSTQECADIFVSINTEQRPAPKSLVYDLFGISSAHIADLAVVRASDIARALSGEESPYRGMIKFPGEYRAKIGIELSTVVNSLKPLVSDNGLFETVGVRGLENQTRILRNFFSVLSEAYGSQWADPDNVFVHAAGFTGAIDFFKLHLMPHCNVKRSSSLATMRKALGKVTTKPLLLRSQLKNLQGRASAKSVTEFLTTCFDPTDDEQAPMEY